jgi:DNA gyrase subunit A
MKKIVTHDSSFHADDAFAVATLQIYLDKLGEKYKVIRSREPEIWAVGDYVVDTGNVYDEDANRFDHHQPEFNEKGYLDIPYSSFGLVWKHFGKILCENNKRVWEKIRNEFVTILDANDNGIDVSLPAINGLEPLDPETFILSFRPSYSERTEENLYKGFLQAVAFAKGFMEREIHKELQKDEARTQLMARFQFSELQSQAILEMRLQRLTGLERDKIVEEYKQILSVIEELRRILGSEKLVYEVIQTELLEVKKVYGDKRRTEIIAGESTEFEVEDLIADELTLVSITHTGYVKRSDPSQFRSQHRGGKGLRGVTTGDEDFVTAIYRTNTLANLLCFTDQGRAHRLKVYKIPEASRAAKGKAIVNLLALAPGEKIKAILPVKEFKENEFVMIVTKLGVIKKTPLSDFGNIHSKGINAINTDEGDELVAARITDGKRDVFLCTRNGMSIRFSEEDVRPMGRTAAGVRGIKLKKKNDRVVGMDVINPKLADKGQLELFVITENGMGKRTNVDEYKTQGRGGSGIKTMNVTDKTGEIVGGYVVNTSEERDLLVISKKGQVIRLPFGSIKSQGRATQGVRLMRFKEEGDTVASTTLV